MTSYPQDRAELLERIERLARDYVSAHGRNNPSAATDIYNELREVIRGSTPTRAD